MLDQLFNQLAKTQPPRQGPDPQKEFSATWEFKLLKFKLFDRLKLVA